MYEKINERIPNFDLHPVFTIDGTQSWKGYQEISKIIDHEMQKYESKCVLVIDSYYHINHKNTPLKHTSFYVSSIYFINITNTYFFNY